MKALPRKFACSYKTLIRDMVKRLPDADGIVRIHRDSLWEDSAVIEYSVRDEYKQLWAESPDSVRWTMAFKMWEDLLNDGYKPFVGKADHIKNGQVHAGNARSVERCSVSRLVALSLRYHRMLMRHDRQKVPVGSVVPGSGVGDNILYPDINNHYLWYHTDIDGKMEVVRYDAADLLIEPLRDGSSRDLSKPKKVKKGVRNRLVLNRHGLTKDLDWTLTKLSRKEFTDRHNMTLQHGEKLINSSGPSPAWAVKEVTKLKKRRSAWHKVNETDKKLLKWWRQTKETDRKVLNQKMRLQFERLWAGQELILYLKPPQPFFNTSPDWDMWAQQRLATAPALKKGQTRAIGQHVAWDLRPCPTPEWAWNEAVNQLFENGYEANPWGAAGFKMRKAHGLTAMARLPISKENRWTNEMLGCVKRYAQQILIDSEPDPLDTTKVVVTYSQFFLYCLSFAKKLHRKNPRRNISDVILDVAQYLVGSMHFAIYQWSTGDKLDRRPGKLRNQWWRLDLNEQELADLERELEVPKIIGHMPPRAFEDLYGYSKIKLPKKPNGDFDEDQWTWPTLDKSQTYDFQTDPSDLGQYLRAIEALKIPTPHRNADGEVTGLVYARRFLMMAGATLYELTDELYGKPRMLLINKKRHGTDTSHKRKGHDGNSWLAAYSKAITTVKPLEDTEITNRFQYVEVPRYETIPDYDDERGRRTKRVVRNYTLSQVRRGKDGKLEFAELVEQQKARMASAGKDFYSDPQARLEKKEERTILRRIGRVAAGKFTELEVEAIKHFLRHGEFRRGDHPKEILAKLRNTGVMMGLKL